MSAVARVLLAGDGTAGRAARWVAAAAAFLVAVQVVFSPPTALYLFGAANGVLYGLIAIGLILIYRTNRIINFAAAGLGSVPAVFALLLMAQKDTPYPVALAVAVVGGVALGAAADVVVIRKFARAPRLILTVATLGLVQILAFVSLYIPRWLGSEEVRASVTTPWGGLTWNDSAGSPILTGDYLFAFVAVAAIAGGLAAFFRFSRVGIALRASAENADRALLLGIPVRTVGTVAWMLAGFLGAMTIFLRAPLVGVPIDGTLGFGVLLFTLAAAVMARMERMGVAVVAGVAVGILEQASVVKTGSSDLSSAMMLGLILGALLLQRGQLSRAHDAGVSTWQAVKEFRPVPLELRGVREVVAARTVLAGAVLALAFGAPFLFDDAEIYKLTLIPIYAIVAVSLVILTGWAGQVSLGQFALVGAGAVTAGKLAADHNVDFWLALVAGVAAGALVALVIGLPAVRVQGLYLAVTTLAFGAATEFYFLKRNQPVGRRVLPNGDAARIERPWLWQRVDLTDERTFYWLCVVFLGVALLAARSFRRNRSGRVLIAARDNGRAAPAYGINLARTRLAAFAVSGGLAALAGVLLAYQQQTIDAATYGIQPSIDIFVSTVIGGLTSLPGAVLGAVVIQTVKLFGESRVEGAQLLVTGPGLLLVLLLVPGGLSEGLYRLRDRALKAVAARHGIHVPSLVADRRVEPDPAEDEIIERAEHHVEEVESFDHIGVATIVCPVCTVELTLESAARHDHLVPAAAGGSAR